MHAHHVVATLPPDLSESTIENLGLDPARCLLKSVVTSELVALLPGMRSEHRSIAGDCQEVSRSLNILVADDAVVNQEVATGILEFFGHTCTAASSGNEAIQSYQQSKFDLIFMDLEMPGMDGLEATGTIRTYEAGKMHIPIYAMTAHALDGTLEKCLAAGMDGWVTKPIQPNILRDILGTISLRNGSSATAS